MNEEQARFLSIEWMFECSLSDWYHEHKDWINAVAHIKRALFVNDVLSREAIRIIDERIINE